MKSLFFLMILGFSSAALSKNFFNCRLKVFGQGKKQGIKIKPLQLKDEMDILKIKDFHTVDMGGHTIKYQGAMAFDDECGSSSTTSHPNRCRMILYVKTDENSPAIAYANKAAKLGAMDEHAKLSCVRDHK